jgi:hypothetical protein
MQECCQKCEWKRQKAGRKKRETEQFRAVFYNKKFRKRAVRVCITPVMRAVHLLREWVQKMLTSELRALNLGALITSLGSGCSSQMLLKMNEMGQKRPETNKVGGEVFRIATQAHPTTAKRWGMGCVRDSNTRDRRERLLTHPASIYRFLDKRHRFPKRSALNPI